MCDILAKKLRKIPITREEVLAEGTRMEFFVCPLCAMNRKVTNKNGERMRFDRVDLNTALVLQVRYGGGIGSGFPMNEAESMTIEQVIQTKEYGDIITQIKVQCQEIVDYIENSET